MIAFLKRTPFLVILLPLVLFYTIVLSHHWIPVHDTLSSFFLGYSFFSHFAEHGQFPFWANFVSWGQPINMPLMANISPFFIFLGPLVKLFPSANLMTIYYLSLFFEELLLATGTYLLANRLYKHTFTKIFITTAMTGSSIWMIEIFFNFRLFYSMPLCLYLLIKTVDTHRLKYFFTGLTILFLTASWGNALYIGIFQGIFFSVFALFYLLIHKLNFKNLIKNIGPSEILIFFLLLILAASSLIFLFSPGLPAFISPGRATDGKLDYLDFLRFNKDHYATSMNGLLYGLREWRDATVYTGFLTVPFALLCLIYRPLKIIVPFVGAAAFTFFLYLSEESFIIPFLFFLPTVKLVRHGYLLTPYIKFCILFVAGFGFDYFYTTAKRKGKKFISLHKFLMITIFLLVLGFLLDWKSMGKDAKSLSICYIISIYFITFIWMHFWGKKVAPSVLFFIVLLTSIDIYNYKTGYIHNILIALNDNEWDLFYPRKIDFHIQRSNERKYFSFTYKLNADKEYAVLNITNQFLGEDKCGGVYRSDTSTPYARDLYHFIEPRYKYDYKLEPTLEKIIACNYSKFQIFSSPPLLDPEQKNLIKRNSITNVIQSFSRTNSLKRDIFLNTWRDFSGKRKRVNEYGSHNFVRKLYQDSIEQFEEELKNFPPLVSNLPIPKVEVLDFNANQMKFTVSTDIKKPELWLYMAEAWHPKWKAFVNGKEEKIELSNWAFRTFKIPSGKSTIQMIYDSSIEAVLIWIVWFFSLLLFGFIFFTTIVLCVNPSLPIVKFWFKILGLLE